MKTLLVLFGALTGGGIFALGIYSLLKNVSFGGQTLGEMVGTEDRPASSPTDAPGREEV